MLFSKLGRIVLLLSLLLAGCAPRVMPPVGTPVAPDIGEALVNQWRARSSMVSSLQGLARADIKSPEKNGAVTQVVLAERPGHFRTESLSPFGTPLLTLAVNAEQIGVLAVSQNVFYTGAASLENLARFTRLPLKASDLVDLLLYKVPIYSGPYQVMALEEGGWMVSVASSGRHQELLFDSQRRLVEARYFKNGELFLTIGFARIGELVEDFPAGFSLDLPEFAISAKLDFSEQAVNRTFLPGIFRLQPPDGVEIINLDSQL